jgi:hypothetical protein
MSRSAFFLTVVASVVTAAVTLGVGAPAGDLPSYVSPQFSHAIAAWLAHHPGYRLAVDADCACAEDIAHVRAGSPPQWPRLPNYHPYYMVGDFRTDGTEDVAVGVILLQHPDKFRVLIIHGAPATAPSAKPFLSPELGLHQGLFFGTPRPKPWRLIVGPFEAEGATFDPVPSGYKLSYDDSEG